MPLTHNSQAEDLAKKLLEMPKGNPTELGYQFLQRLAMNAFKILAGSLRKADAVEDIQVSEIDDLAKLLFHAKEHFEQYLKIITTVINSDQLIALQHRIQELYLNKGEKETAFVEQSLALFKSEIQLKQKMQDETGVLDLARRNIASNSHLAYLETLINFNLFIHYVDLEMRNARVQGATESDIKSSQLLSEGEKKQAINILQQHGNDPTKTENVAFDLKPTRQPATITPELLQESHRIVKKNISLRLENLDKKRSEEQKKLLALDNKLVIFDTAMFNYFSRSKNTETAASTVVIAEPNKATTPSLPLPTYTPAPPPVLAVHVAKLPALTLLKPVAKQPIPREEDGLPEDKPNPAASSSTERLTTNVRVPKGPPKNPPPPVPQRAYFDTKPAALDRGSNSGETATLTQKASPTPKLPAVKALPPVPPRAKK